MPRCFRPSLSLQGGKHAVDPRVTSGSGMQYYRMMPTAQAAKCARPTGSVPSTVCAVEPSIQWRIANCREELQDYVVSITHSIPNSNVNACTTKTRPNRGRPGSSSTAFLRLRVGPDLPARGRPHAAIARLIEKRGYAGPTRHRRPGSPAAGSWSGAMRPARLIGGLAGA